jgi:hypothetical protein
MTKRDMIVTKTRINQRLQIISFLKVFGRLIVQCLKPELKPLDTLYD